MNDYKDRPIQYLEIGTFHAANILSVANSYGSHNDSKLYYIDPWEEVNFIQTSLTVLYHFV